MDLQVEEEVGQLPGVLRVFLVVPGVIRVLGAVDGPVGRVAGDGAFGVERQGDVGLAVISHRDSEGGAVEGYGCPEVRLLEDLGGDPVQGLLEELCSFSFPLALFRVVQPDWRGAGSWGLHLLLLRHIRRDWLLWRHFSCFFVRVPDFGVLGYSK